MRPKPEAGHLLRDFVGGIEIGVADAGHVGSQADEDMPGAVQIGKMNDVTEEPVSNPARNSYAPPQRRHGPNMVDPGACAPP